MSEQSFEDYVRDRINGTNGAWVEVRAELKRRDAEKARIKAAEVRTKRLPKKDTK